MRFFQSIRELKNLFGLSHGEEKPQFAFLGAGVEIEPGVHFGFPSRIRIGDYVHIEPRGFLEGKGGLEIEDHVIIAPEVVILTSLHRYKEAHMVPYDQIDLLKPVKIERCVWIGMRAMILPGVTIGEGAIIGAGALVTKSCGPGTILGGNPAVKIGERDMNVYYDLLEKKRFYLMLKQKNHLQKIEVAMTGDRREIG